MADDDDVIYVDVSARLDEAAAERATGRLRDKFKDAGKSIGSAVTSDIGRELASAAWPELENLGKSLGRNLTKSLGDSIGGFWGDAVENLGGAALDATLGSIGDKLKGVKDTADGVKASFADLGKGNAAEGLSGVAKALNDIAGDNAASDVLKDISDKARPLQDQFSSIKDGIKETVGGFSALVAGAPALEAALAGISEAAGPLALVATAIATIYEGLPGIGGGLKDILAAPDPTKGFNSPIQGPPGIPVTGPRPLTLPPGMGGTGPAVPPGYTATPGSLDPFAALLPPGMAPPPGTGPGAVPSIAPPDTGGGVGTRSSFSGGRGTRATLVDYTTPSDPTISTPEDIPGAAGGVANLFRVAESLQGTPYSMPLRNDCSGMVSRLANAALGLPPAASFSTANEGQWLSSHGFRPGVGGPGDFNVGWHQGGPGGGHTAATLPGGVNAESGGSVGSFTLGGPVGAGSSQFENHMYLPMGGARGGAAPAGYGTRGGAGAAGGPGAPGGGVAPDGGGGFGGPVFGGGTGGPPSLPMTGGPVGVAGGTPGVGAGAPTLPGYSGTNAYGKKDVESMGSGSGFGLTGSGLIGLAENLPGMLGTALASGASYDGSGAASGAAAAVAQQLWANIGEPELNLAIQKGGQMAATAAMAPIEESWLGGGMMGAPDVGSPASSGWTGKMLSSLMGSQFTAPNLAGAVQPPKQPSDDDDSDSNNDNGGSSPGKGGKSGKGSPSGGPDDPLHVNVTNPPAGQPQGSATNASDTAATAATPAMAI